MCAIAGILNFEQRRPVDQGTLIRMRDSMSHRGPDDAGLHVEGPVGLAARRLSIIDPVSGHQPVHNEDKTVWVVLNGEIYNFKLLRRDLEGRGHQFHSQSDTEVLVHAYEDFGLEFLQRIRGMFALALWDQRRQRLVLARDRMGEKPLHFYWGPGELVFGSELKSLFHHPAVPREMDPGSLSKYLTLQYVPAPRTIFKGIQKLLPGHLMIVSSGENQQPIQQAYWDMPPAEEPPTPPSVDSVGKEFLTLLRKSVKSQLVSDVPAGVLMSGGLDSTLVATFAAEAQPGIQAFTMAFEEPSFDESRRAKLVAERIGCRHQIEVCRAGDMIGLLPRVVSILDEPMADASILPTFLLTRFAAQSVKVALGGDGGDELFAGYPTLQALRYRSVFRTFPKIVRHALERGVAALPISQAYLSMDFKLRQFLRGVDGTVEEDFCCWMGAFTSQEQKQLLTTTIRQKLRECDALEGLASTSAIDSDVQKCLYLCAKHYLQDGVLVKVDRASMANSLEVRSPFLDTDLVNFAARCPLEYKMTLTQTKWIVRQAARDILPGEIVWASKRGFAAPIGKWIIGELKDLFRDMLHPDRIHRGDIFEPAEVQRLLDGHMSGKQNNARVLWTLLVFELWKERMTSASIGQPPAHAQFPTAADPASKA